MGGSIEATVKVTQPDDPVFVFDPSSGQATSGFEGPGVVIMAVDNLPCELPREATLSFGQALTPLIPGAVAADYGAGFDGLVLPAPLKRATIVHRGALTPAYRYLGQHI